MNIEEFFIKSVGEWNSMRSGHSLAFQEFEEIRSKIKIVRSQRNDSRVIKLSFKNLITLVSLLLEGTIFTLLLISSNS